MKWGCVLLAVGLFTGALLLGFKSGSHEKVIEAEKFILKTPHGRAVLEMRVEDHKPIIALCDERGSERLLLEGGGKPGIVIKNGSNHAVVQIRDFEKDGAGFVLYDASGNKRFQVQGGTQPGFFVLNEENTVIANLSTTQSGSANLSLRDQNQQPLISLSGSDNPSMLMKSGGKSQLEMVATNNGAMVKFNDTEGQPRVQLQGGSSPGVYLREEKGEVIGSFIGLKSGGAAIGLGNSNGDIAAFLRGGQNPSLSFFQDDKEPDVILGIAEKAPHLIMSKNKKREGVLIYGGSPSSMLFVNERGEIPVILSKHGLLQNRAASSKEKKEKKNDKFYSWEEFEDPLKDAEGLRKR